MSASALKRMWPTLIVPEVREWVIERVERGSLQRIEVGVNSPVRNLSRRGPPIPDDGLAINIVASGVTLHPVDELPSVRDADLKAHVTGRTATVTIGQAAADTPGGTQAQHFAILCSRCRTWRQSPRRRGSNSGSTARCRRQPKFSPPIASANFPAPWSIPIRARERFRRVVTLGLPIKRELTKADTTYAITADLGGFAADQLVMNQKLEANALKVVANNPGYQVKGDVKINGQAASLDYRKPSEGDADIKLQATLDDASRARLGSISAPRSAALFRSS